MTTDPKTDRLIRAPWTPEQVAALNAFQERGGMHPFTCGRETHGVRLVLLAHRDGWHCSDPACDYRQDWAHAFMAERGRAVAAAAVSSPPPDQTALRARLAEAMAKRDGHPWPTEFEDDERDYYRRADAALGVLPPPADRAAVYRELADQQTQLAVADDLARRRDLAGARRQLVKELRRLADEAQQQCPGVETVPNRCTCDCEGCKHHCGAHNPAEAQQPDTEPPFVTRVLEIFATADAHGELFWRVVDGQPDFAANVSDVFAWGGADAEPIRPETLPVLEQALADLKALDAAEFVADLYAARLRKMRPQGAAYPSGTHKAWREVSALYDACGPERDLSLGNPKPAPAHKEA